MSISAKKLPVVERLAQGAGVAAIRTLTL
jgi:hypothetical protein